MTEKRKRITLNDVAKIARVSASTVSRALKNDRRISKEVSLYIKEVAAQIEYIPNITARSLKTGSTNTIGLLVRDISDEWSGALIPFIEKECTLLNYALLLSNADSSAEREKYYLRVFQQRNTEGILILTPLSSDQKEYIPYAESVPLVLVDTYLKNPKINVVTVDHELGAYLSTSHLIQLGHRNIVFITGPLNISPSRSYKHGYKRALKERNIDFDERNFIATKIIDIDHGYQTMHSILRKNKSITAVATGSDLMAAGAMKAIRNEGLRIPQDISIVGYDDIPLSDLLTPPLTTIKQDREVLGKLAVKSLMGVIHNSAAEPEQIIIPPEIVIRKSTTRIS